MMVATACAAASVALAWVAGAPWLALGVASAAWAAGALLRGMPRVLLFIAAPVVLAVSVRPELASWASLAGAPAVVLAVVPLFASLGPLRVRPLAIAVALTPWLAAFALTFTPPGQLLASSDLATGAITVAVAAALIALAPVAARVGR